MPINTRNTNVAAYAGLKQFIALVRMPSSAPHLLTFPCPSIELAKQRLSDTRPAESSIYGIVGLTELAEGCAWFVDGGKQGSLYIDPLGQIVAKCKEGDDGFDDRRRLYITFKSLGDGQLAFLMLRGASLHGLGDRLDQPSLRQQD